MNTDMVMITLISSTLFISLIGIGFTIYWFIATKRFIKSYYKFFKSMWIDRKRGMPDNCRDIPGLFLYEYIEGKIK